MSIIESVQSYDLNIQPGRAQNIDVQGDRVQFLSATDPNAQIELRPNFSQGNITLKVGQGFRFSSPVSRWVVMDASGAGITGQLLIGSGDFFDQRVVGSMQVIGVPTVSAIDAAKARVLAGNAFRTQTQQSRQDATTYTMMQLWNPVGSGKNVVVKSAKITLPTASTIGMLTNDTVPLSFDWGQAPIRNRLMGGRASTAQLRREFKGSGPNGYFGALIGTAAYSSDDFIKPDQDPIILVPGTGITAAVYAADLWTQFDWFEE